MLLPPLQRADRAEAPFPVSPEICLLAPGVCHTFGWTQPPGPGPFLRIPLKQTWCTNALLATLTACEDLRPAFNLSRGGCNIDAALVALQGPSNPQAGGQPLVTLQHGVRLA